MALPEILFLKMSVGTSAWYWAEVSSMAILVDSGQLKAVVELVSASGWY